MYGDRKWLRYMDEVWGLDVLGQQGTKKVQTSSLDPYMFWEDSSLDVEA